MQKLVTYISKLKEASQVDGVLIPPPRGIPKMPTNRSLTVEEVEVLAKKIYPDLTGEEEEEIRRCLGISPGAGDTKTLIVDTMKRIASSRNTSVALISKKEAEEAGDDDGGGNDFSTFRISTADDFSGSDDDAEEEAIEEAIKNNQHSTKGKRSTKRSRGLSAVLSAGNFETEEWERRIMAIERGEWLEGMEDNGWRRWKKDRPKLLRDNLFDKLPSNYSDPNLIPTPAQSLTSIGVKSMHSITAKIPFAEFITDDGEDFCTSFILSIEWGDLRWGVTRRYSEFRRLVDDLQVAFPNQCRADSFPPKRVLYNFEAIHIEERRVQLESWLSSILLLSADNLIDSPTMLRFLSATMQDIAKKTSASESYHPFEVSVNIDDNFKSEMVLLEIKKSTKEGASAWKKTSVAGFSLKTGETKIFDCKGVDINEVLFFEVYEWNQSTQKGGKFVGAANAVLGTMISPASSTAKLWLASPHFRGWWGFEPPGVLTISSKTT